MVIITHEQDGYWPSLLVFTDSTEDERDINQQVAAHLWRSDITLPFTLCCYESKHRGPVTLGWLGDRSRDLLNDQLNAQLGSTIATEVAATKFRTLYKAHAVVVYHDPRHTNGNWAVFYEDQLWRAFRSYHSKSLRWPLMFGDAHVDAKLGERRFLGLVNASYASLIVGDQTPLESGCCRSADRFGRSRIFAGMRAVVRMLAAPQAEAA